MTSVLRWLRNRLLRRSPSPFAELSRKCIAIQILRTTHGPRADHLI